MFKKSTSGLADARLAGCAVLLGVLAGCAATAPPDAPPLASPSNAVERQLRALEQQWHGTPYRWGGHTRAGIDCSGFALVAYRDLFGLALPRTTAEQAQAGRPVAPDGLQAGDLVFFRPAGRVQHVGIYLGNGEFAHAATSRGVMVSHLDDAYWRTAYWTTRRILPDAPDAGSLLPDGEADRPGTRRTGW